jgi:hypothetical protein
MIDARAVRRRINVDVEHDAESLGRQLHALRERKPSGSVVLLDPFGFAFAREPAIFHFVATGFSLGMGIMLVEFSGRIGRAAVILQSMAGVFFVLAVALMGYFLQQLFLRTEVMAQGDEVVHRVTLAGRTLRATRYRSDDVVAVVVHGDGEGPLRISLAGPRHAKLGEVYVTHALDPDSTALWIAELVAVVARRASVRG